METIRCPNCGETIGEDEVMCPFCDEELVEFDFNEYEKAVKDYTHRGPNHRT